MPLPVSAFVRRGACLVGGLLMGYLLWAAYFTFNWVPEAAMVAVIRAVGRWMPVIGGHSTESLSIFLAFVAGAAPSAIAFGLFAGAALMRSPHARWFFYPVLMFPVAWYAFTSSLLSQMEGVAGAQVVRPLWDMGSHHVQIQFAIYVQFYVAAFVAGKAAAWRRRQGSRQASATAD